MCTSKGTQNQYTLSEVLTIRVGLYMTCTQGQDEEYLYFIWEYVLARYVLNKLHCALHGVEQLILTPHVPQNLQSLHEQR